MSILTTAQYREQDCFDARAAELDRDADPDADWSDICKALAEIAGSSLGYLASDSARIVLALDGASVIVIRATDTPDKREWLAGHRDLPLLRRVWRDARALVPGRDAWPAWAPAEWNDTYEDGAEVAR